MLYIFPNILTFLFSFPTQGEGRAPPPSCPYVAAPLGIRAKILQSTRRSCWSSLTMFQVLRNLTTNGLAYFSLTLNCFQTNCRLIAETKLITSPPLHQRYCVVLAESSTRVANDISKWSVCYFYTTLYSLMIHIGHFSID